MPELDRRCVLVVEDEFYLAKGVKKALEAAGADVLGPFPRERDGLAALERRTPDCAILDINTGAGASFTLADTLVERGVPFVFYTGYDRAVIPQRFSEVRRLQKPVDGRKLVSTATEICCGVGDLDPA